MKSKLTKCKTCGAEIAKSANVCPHCGANATFRKPLVIIGLIIWCMAVFFMVRACDVIGGGEDRTAPSSSGDSESSQRITVSASDLWQAYTDNKVNADNLYKDKTLEITGVIVDIGTDMLLDDPCVSLKSGDQLGIYPVQCFFTDDKHNEQVAALKDGDSITIVGRCTGAQIANIQLTDCSLPD